MRLSEEIGSKRKIHDSFGVNAFLCFAQVTHSEFDRRENSRRYTISKVVTLHPRKESVVTPLRKLFTCSNASPQRGKRFLFEGSCEVPKAGLSLEKGDYGIKKMPRCAAGAAGHQELNVHHLPVDRASTQSGHGILLTVWISVSPATAIDPISVRSFHKKTGNNSYYTPQKFPLQAWFGGRGWGMFSTFLIRRSLGEGDSK